MQDPRTSSLVDADLEPRSKSEVSNSEESVSGGIQTSGTRANMIPDQDPQTLEAGQEIVSDTDNVAVDTIRIAAERTKDGRRPKAPDVPYDMFFTRPMAPTLLDLCKRLIEQVAGCPLSWWPLTEPEDELKPGYTRVYSKQFVRPSTYSQLSPANTDSRKRGTRFYDDIPSAFADKLFPHLSTSRAAAPKPQWWTFKREAVVLKDTTLMRLLHTYSTSVRGQDQESGGRLLAN